MGLFLAGILLGIFIGVGGLSLYVTGGINQILGKAASNENSGVVDRIGGWVAAAGRAVVRLSVVGIDRVRTWVQSRRR